MISSSGTPRLNMDVWLLSLVLFLWTCTCRTMGSCTYPMTTIVPRIEGFVDHHGPAVTRHRTRRIHCWHEMKTNISTLPSELRPFVIYFTNWCGGRVYNSSDDPQLTSSVQPLPISTVAAVSAWYNYCANRMDIGMCASITSADSEKMCVWNLSFEPWCPVIKSKLEGVFDVTSLMALYNEQRKKQ